VPTLGLHVDIDACNDPVTGKEKYFTNGYKRQVLSNVGHFPQREDPQTVANEITVWLGG
jgi:pimeloyl-ACP methyl ester carboxylesterase